MHHMPTKTDRELLAVWRETGDEAAFAELVARHRQMIYRTGLRMLGNVQDAEDAVQAVFVVLVRKADRVRREGSLGGWLHKVTRHVALQALARRASHERRKEELAMWHEAKAGETPPDADWDAVLRYLDEELAALSEPLRQAVVLRYLQGNSEKAAAELAGCPLGTLSRRASQGLAKLRQRLAKRGVTLSGVALAGLLASEASSAVPETLLPSLLATVKGAVATSATGTGWDSVALGAKDVATSTPGTLAQGAMRAMFIAQVKMTALVTAVVMGVGGASVTAVVAVAREQGKAAEEGKAAEKVAPPAAAAATNATADGSGAPPSRERTICSFATTFEAARRDLILAGVRVFELRRWRDEFPDANDHRADLVRPTPIEIRRKRMPLADYVQDLARNRGGEKVFWLLDGAVAILVKDVSNEEFAALKEELASPDDAIRVMAAERAATFPTVPAVRLLIEVTGDRNPAVAEAARRSLLYLGWGAALTLNEKVWTWMEADLAKLRPTHIPWFELALAGGERVLPALRQAVAEQVQLKESAFVPQEEYRWSPFSNSTVPMAYNYSCDPIVNPFVDRYHPAILALGLISGPAAQKEIEALVQDKDSDVRRSAILALLYAGSVGCLAPLEKEIRASSQEDAYRWSLPLYLAGTLDNERAKAFLRQTVRDTAGKVSQSDAARLLCASGDANDRAFVKTALTEDSYKAVVASCRDDGDWTSVTNSISVEALRGENLLLRAKAALNHSEGKWAISALARMSTPEARALLDEYLVRIGTSDDSGKIRDVHAIRLALAKTPSERRALIEKAVDSGNSRSVCQYLECLSSEFPVFGGVADHARVVLRAAYRNGIPQRPNLWPQAGGRKAYAVCQEAILKGDYDSQHGLFTAARYLGGEEELDLLAAACGARGQGYNRDIVQNMMAGRNTGRLRVNYHFYNFIGLAHLADGSNSAAAQRAETLFLQGVTNQDVNIRLTALTSLPFLGNGMAWSLSETALADPDAAIRWSAVRNITDMLQLQGVAEKTLTLVEQAMDDKDPAVRDQATAVFPSVSRFLPKATADREREILKKRLTDPDDGVREKAVEAMIYRRWGNRYVEGAIASQAVQELLKHPSRDVRIAAMGGVRGPDPLLELFAKDTDKSVRLAAAQWLWSQFRSDARVKELLSAEKVEALITESLADPDAAVRAVAAGSRLHDFEKESRDKLRDKLMERLVVETDKRVHQRIWQSLYWVSVSRPLLAKASQKYFLARLAVADAREVMEIKEASEEGRYPGDGLVKKAITDREAALKAQGATNSVSAPVTSPTPNEKPPLDQGDDF